MCSVVELPAEATEAVDLLDEEVDDDMAVGEARADVAAAGRGGLGLAVVVVLLDVLDPAVSVLLLVLLLEHRVVTRGSEGKERLEEVHSLDADLVHILDAGDDEVLARRVKLVLLGEGVRS